MNGLIKKLIKPARRSHIYSDSYSVDGGRRAWKSFRVYEARAEISHYVHLRADGFEAPAREPVLLKRVRLIVLHICGKNIYSHFEPCVGYMDYLRF